MNGLEAIIDRVDRGGGSEREKSAVWFLRAVLPAGFPELSRYELSLWLSAVAGDLSDNRAFLARRHEASLRRIADDEGAPKGARALAKRLLEAKEEKQR